MTKREEECGAVGASLEQSIIDQLDHAGFSCCVIRNRPCPHFANIVKVPVVGKKGTLKGVNGFKIECAKFPSGPISATEATACSYWKEIVVAA